MCPQQYVTSFLHKDIISFFRKIRLKKFFADNEGAESDTNLSGCKPQSTFTPTLDMVGPEVAIFERAVLRDLQTILKYNQKSPPNMAKQQLEALQSLQESQAITVKPCDKGGGIVLMSTDKYNNKILDMLSVPRHYRPARRAQLKLLTEKIEADKALEQNDICQQESVP